MCLFVAHQQFSRASYHPAPPPRQPEKGVTCCTRGLPGPDRTCSWPRDTADTAPPEIHSSLVFLQHDEIFNRQKRLLCFTYTVSVAWVAEGGLTRTSTLSTVVHSLFSLPDFGWLPPVYPDDSHLAPAARNKPSTSFFRFLASPMLQERVGIHAFDNGLLGAFLEVRRCWSSV